jgi:type II secretory pathway pseudopilin PulG
MTLVELLIGLAVTGIIAAAIGTVLLSTSQVAASQEASRSALVLQASAEERIRSALRSAHTVLACTPKCLLLWKAETCPNDVPNLSELQLIEFDEQTGRLFSYEAPGDVPPEADTEYPLATTDFAAAATTLKASGALAAKLWATDVTAWSAAPNASEVTAATFLAYRLTVTVEDTTREAVGGAALRN